MRLAARDRFLSIGHDGPVLASDADGSSAAGLVDLDSDPLFAPFVDAALAGWRDGFHWLPTLDDLLEAKTVIHHAYGGDPPDSTARLTWAK